MTRDKKCRARWALFVVTTMVLIMTGSSLWALNSETNRSTLRGLKGVRVLVEDLPPEVEQELKLRTAGIKTLTQEECLKTPGEPYLYININLNSLNTEGDIYSHSIDIGLIQNVVLQRAPGQATYAITWSTGGVGLIGKKHVSELQDSVGDLVSIFVKAFLSVNPKN
jgi:hypothetical protein